MVFSAFAGSGKEDNEGGEFLKYIYFCWGSAHSSVTAAAVHLGHLPDDRVPTLTEVMAAPRFDQTPNNQIGTLFFMGNDDAGDEVYILGLGAQYNSFKYIVSEYLQMLGLAPVDYRLVNCLPCVNLPTRLGGFSSRSLGAVWFGRRLAAWGVMRSYSNYVKVVRWAQSSRQQLRAFLDWVPPL